MDNALFSIQLYKIGKTWFFDDKKLNVKQEAFVSGASECISLHKKRIGNRKKKPYIAFSLSPIPDADIVLTCTEKSYPMHIVGYETTKITFDKFTSKWESLNKVPKYAEDKSKEPTSAWYVDQFGNKLWLCPCQLKYFGKVADTIWAKFL